MHFQTLVLAGLSTLAAVAALPSGSSHDSHVLPRHHRFIRRAKPDAPSAVKVKRCAASSTSTTVPEPTITTPADPEAGNIAVAEPTSTSKTSKSGTKSRMSTVRTSATGTKTATSDVEEPTAIVSPGGGGGINISDKLLAVFPAGLKAGAPNWSMNAAVKGALALTDENLGATKINSKLSHPTIEHEGKRAQQISYSKGAVAYNDGPLGGVSIYAAGPSGQKLNNAKVATFSFSAYFEEGFDFNKGGKLPGLYGGTSENEAAGCSGGKGRDTCFSCRVMWREGGKGELYGYFPPGAKSTNKAAVCSDGNTSCDLGYGWSLGRGTWSWPTGKWMTMAQKVTLNDVGKANGSVIIYIDGKVTYEAKNIVLRVNKAVKFQGVMIQSFFGGHTNDWACPKDQKAYFADYSVAVLETE